MGVEEAAQRASCLRAACLMCTLASSAPLAPTRQSTGLERWPTRQSTGASPCRWHADGDGTPYTCTNRHLPVHSRQVWSAISSWRFMPTTT